MVRRTFLKNIGLSGFAMAMPFASLLADNQKPKNKPNVLFITIDDLRPKLGCYGQEQIISPNIDRLAAQGVLFTESFCQVPVCGASRASLLTGLRPTRTRFTSFATVADEDAPGIDAIPKHFKKNGYHTISNGKVFHHYEKDGAGGWSEEPWHANGWVDAPWYPKGNWRNYLTDENLSLALHRENGAGKAWEAADVPDEAYFDGATAEKTVNDLVRLKDSDKPFFLAVGFRKPHLPFNAPKKYWDFYKRNEIKLADNPLVPKGAPDSSLPDNLWEINAYEGIPYHRPISDDETSRTLIHGYYACVSYIDAQIGIILDELEKQNLRDNTIIVLCGDHGFHLGEHSLWSKFTCYRESLRAPLIISAPGIKGGQKTSGLTEFIDVYPTLCELSNLRLPDHLQGESFVRLMQNPELPWKQAVFSRIGKGDSVRTKRYRYTEWTKDDREIYARMLYDHQSDPNENKNIAELPENKDLVNKFSKMLKKNYDKS